MKNKVIHKKKTLAREAFFKFIFAKSFASEQEYVSDQFKAGIMVEGEYDKVFFNDLIASYLEHGVQVRQRVDQHLQTRRVLSCSKLEMSILLAGCVELLYFPQTPKKVVINESIEFAKVYGSDGGYKLVNAVLDSIAKSLDR